MQTFRVLMQKRPNKENMLDTMVSAVETRGDTFIPAASMDTGPLAKGTESLNES